MSQATISSLPSPSRSKKRTLATTGTWASPGGFHGCLREAQAAVARPARARGSGSVTGERASK